MIAVFDIDGVLADNSDYETWFINGIFAPDLFLKALPYFKVNKWALELLNGLKFNNVDVVLLTARREQFRPETEDWLYNNLVGYDILIMNKNQEDAPNFKLKELKKIDDEIIFVVEDEPNTVKKLRDNGYIVLQPNNLF